MNGARSGRRRRAQGRGRDCRLAVAGRGEQHTQNMQSVVVTRDMSQLAGDGWLKSHAFCRGSQAGHTVRGGLRAGRREVASECAQRAVEKARLHRLRGAQGAVRSAR